MTFDPDKYLASKKEAAPKEAISSFDPDAYLASKAQPQERKAEAFTQGFGNAASLGYLPQLQAIAEPYVQAVTDKFLPADPEGFTVQEAPQKDYTQRRDQYIKEGQQLAEENPYSSLAGNLAGTLATGIATGGGVSKLLGTGARAATFGGRLAQAGKTGAAIGLVRNPGDTEGEVNLVQPLERIKNAGSDALTAMLFQGGVEGVGKVGTGIKNAGQSLKTFAEKRALNAAGAMKKDFKLLEKLGIKQNVGRTLIDEGIVQAGDDVADVAEKLVAKKSEIGSNVEKVYKETSDELANNPHLDNKINAHKIIDEYEAELVKKYKGKADGKSVVSKIKDKLDALRENPEEVTLEELIDIRKDIQGSAKKAGAWGVNQDSDVANELKILRNKFQDAGTSKISEVDQVLGTNKSKILKDSNKLYSEVKAAEPIVKDGLSRDESNRIFGLSEQIAMGSGLATGGPIAAVPLGIASRVVKKYGDSVAATTADKLSKIISTNPKALGVFAEPLLKAASISPQRFSVQLNMMMKRPDFKKAIELLPELNSMPLAEDSSPGPSRSPSQKFTRKNQ